MMNDNYFIMIECYDNDYLYTIFWKELSADG